MTAGSQSVKQNTFIQRHWVASESAAHIMAETRLSAENLGRSMYSEFQTEGALTTLAPSEVLKVALCGTIVMCALVVVDEVR